MFFFGSENERKITDQNIFKRVFRRALILGTSVLLYVLPFGIPEGSAVQNSRCQRPVYTMKKFAKAFMKSARHDIVQDGIDGRIDIEHHSAEV